MKRIRAEPVKRTYSARELYQLMREYKLAYFCETQTGNTWMKLSVLTSGFTIKECEDCSIIEYKVNAPDCMEGGITLAGNAFVLDFEDFGWSLAGTLTSDRHKNAIYMTLYRKI